MNAAGPDAVRVRNVQAADLDQVAAIDLEITRLSKPGYWAGIYQRYGTGRRQQRFFLVAEAAGRIEGFVIGEVRDWEFGSPRCGWVFAISVRPSGRLAGIGSRLLEAICAEDAKAGYMASSSGSASAVPAPRRNVRRGIDFLKIIMVIELSSSEMARS